MTNAAAAMPARTIDLGDRPRKVVLDLNAFCLLEEKLEREARDKHNSEQARLTAEVPGHQFQPFPGLSVLEAVKWNKPGVRDLRLILWASLLSDDPDLSLEQLGKLCSFEKLNELSPVLHELIFSAFPQVQQKVGADEEVVEEKKRKRVAQA